MLTRLQQEENRAAMHARIEKFVAEAVAKKHDHEELLRDREITRTFLASSMEEIERLEDEAFADLARIKAIQRRLYELGYKGY